MIETFYQRACDFTDASPDTWQAGRLYDDSAADLEGWYAWHCEPGCLPDSDPFGPYETEEAASEAAWAAAGCCKHGVSEEDECTDCPAPTLYVLRAQTLSGTYYASGHHSARGHLRAVLAWADPEAAQRVAGDLDDLARDLGARFEVYKLTDAEAREWGRA